MRRFHIHTFGCQMNRYDSERVAALLSARGWISVEIPEEADLLLINTCSVREKPLQKVFSYAGRYAPIKKEREFRIVVMGCVAQQLGTELIERAPYIDGVFGPGCAARIPDVVEKGLFPAVMTARDSLAERELFPSEFGGLWSGSFSAYLTVMHGCDNWCSYCIVPRVRGPEVSRSSGEILREITTLTAQGIREVTLLGQNVNRYRDPDDESDFTALLYRIAERTTLDRIRFVTSHPRDFTTDLAAAFARIPALMPYLHLPAQSGSDPILSAMRRGYTRTEYEDRIGRARESVPDISLSSDFIVGFPGETAEDFAATIDLLSWARYDTVFAFKYSPRPDTAAAAIPELLTEEEKLDRLNRLLAAQNDLRAVTRHRFLDRVVQVLVESESPRGGSMMGRSEHNQIVHVSGATDGDRGKILPVRVTEVLENTLRGVPVPRSTGGTR